ncbi:MAG: hypothetical protein BEN18_05165 [Epulopiscium sp. Nuni2H_MBin001]|nr:MAG: hypothetical protein BEN18_05165 [Epulopiscium sp. Nuni2H_MBin001]
MLSRFFRELSYNLSRKKNRRYPRSSNGGPHVSHQYVNYTRPPRQASGSARQSGRTQRTQHPFTLDGQTLVSVAFIMAAGFIFFTNCSFGGGDEDEDIEVTSSLITQEVISIEDMTENFLDVDYDGISSVVSLAINSHKPMDLALGIWHVETLNGTDLADIEELIKSGVETEEYSVYRDMYSQFIFDLVYFAVGDYREYEYGELDGDDTAVILIDPNGTSVVEVVNMGNGKVIKADWREGTGYTVQVQLDGGAVIAYGYLDEIPSHIKAGVSVAAGEWLGMMSDLAGSVEGESADMPISVYIQAFVGYEDGWVPINIAPFMERIESNKMDVRWVSN